MNHQVTPGADVSLVRLYQSLQIKHVSVECECTVEALDAHTLQTLRDARHCMQCLTERSDPLVWLEGHVCSECVCMLTATVPAAVQGGTVRVITHSGVHDAWPCDGFNLRTPHFTKCGSYAFTTPAAPVTHRNKAMEAIDSEVRQQSIAQMGKKKRKTLVRFIEKNERSMPEGHALMTRPELVEWMVSNNLIMLPSETTESNGGVRRLRIHLPKQGGHALPIAGVGISSWDQEATYRMKQDGSRDSQPVNHHDTGKGVHFVPIEGLNSPNSPHTYVIEKVLPEQKDIPVMVESQAGKSQCAIM